MKHDNLRDMIGQVISDHLSEHWDQEHQCVRLDIFDSRNIDVIADAVLKATVEYEVAFIDKVDMVLQTFQETFGDRRNPPRAITAMLALSMASQLREHCARLKAG